MTFSIPSQTLSERKLKLNLKSLIILAAFSAVITGCSNKINQTGSWLVASDSSMVPTYFNSVKDSSRVTSQQVNVGLATGSSSSLILGKVPWTEADLLIEFIGLDSVADAQTIVSANVTFLRSPYLLQPAGANIHTLQLSGYALDTTWNGSTATWDTLNALGYGSQNIVTSTQVTDTSVVIQLDSAAVRGWALAVSDSNYKNFGFVIKPQNDEGVLSVYGPAYLTSGYIPVCTVICMKNGLPDTVTSSTSYATSVAQTSIRTSAPAGPYRLVQAGTGEKTSISFDLSRIPKYSIVNSATLTLYTDTISQKPYTVGYHSDSLEAFYVSDPTTWSFGTGYPATGIPSGDSCIFDVKLIVQHILNTQNYGFLISHYYNTDNVDTRFVYDENAPDSLKPRLTITYTPTTRR